MTTKALKFDRIIGQWWQILNALRDCSVLHAWMTDGGRYARA